MGEKLGGPILGFQITDNSYAILNEEDARRWQRENAVSDTCILFLFLKPVGEPMGPFSSAGPRLESQVLHAQVALGDGYQVKPRWRRCGQNWRHIVDRNFRK